MEFLVLNNYIKRKQESKKNWIATFKSMGIVKTIIFILLFISAINSIIMLFLNTKLTNYIMAISIIIELWCDIMMYIITQKECIKNSQDDIKKLDKKYDEIRDWLEGLGFSKKNEIKQLCNRCRQAIIKNNEKNDNMKKFIDRIFSLFLLPIFAAAISWIMGASGDWSERMSMAIAIGILGIIIYIFVFGLIGFFEPIVGSDYENMSRMVKDIQGMLDRKFPIENSDII